MQFRERYKYDLKSDFINAGGFSRVYKAYDTKLGMYVALKVYSSQLSSKYDLITEIKKVIQLQHPNLCRYYDFEELESVSSFGESEKIQIGIMEYIDGGDIKLYLKAHPELIDKLLTDVLHGLSFLHRNGVIHRDIKPRNILISTKFGATAKITDFGISKLVSDVVTEESKSALLGTPQYMAPEQFNSKQFGVNGKCTYNLDIWSFGVMTYEIITGKSLIGSNASEMSTGEIISYILRGIEMNDLENVPDKYRRIIERCLVPNADKRIRNVDTLIDILNERPDAKKTEERNERKADEEERTRLFTPAPKPVHTPVPPPVQPSGNGNFPSVYSPKVRQSEIKKDPPKSNRSVVIIMISILVLGFIVILIRAYSSREDYGDYTTADSTTTSADTAVMAPAMPDTTSMMADTSKMMMDTTKM